MENVEENNLLIADFMGLYKTELGEWVDGGDKIALKWKDNGVGYRLLRYHESWDWLIPVVERIENTYLDAQGYENQFYIMLNTAWVEPSNWGGKMVEQIISSTKIEAVYKAVVTFIRLYNLRK